MSARLLALEILKLLDPTLEFMDWENGDGEEIGTKLRGLVAALEVVIAKAVEPVEIDWPDYHTEAMGCGLEDRQITNRYEAMQYGWDQAIEHVAERLPDKFYAAPQEPAAPAWMPIETAPKDGECVVVYWMEDGEPRYDFDYIEEGGWVKHADHYDHYCMVACEGMTGPNATPPYTHWIPLPTAPGSAS